MNDNDILINWEDADKAWHLLIKEGFTFNTPKSPLHLKIMKDISHHLPALYKEGYALEIHTRLFDHKTTREMGNPDLFENTIEITIDNSKARILSEKLHLEYLVNHFERHLRAGESQLRIYADILMLSKEDPAEFPEQFILNPDQSKRTEFRKTAFKAKVNFIHPKYRLFYILGDLFPSVTWMKERYRCSGIKTILYYPHRLGKLWWML